MTQFCLRLVQLFLKHDAHETTLTVTDPTADRTITLPNETGTLITSASAATNAFSISIAAALG